MHARHVLSYHLIRAPHDRPNSPYVSIPEMVREAAKKRYFFLVGKPLPPPLLEAGPLKKIPFLRPPLQEEN